MTIRRHGLRLFKMVTMKAMAMAGVVGVLGRRGAMVMADNQPSILCTRHGALVVD